MQAISPWGESLLLIDSVYRREFKTTLSLQIQLLKKSLNHTKRNYSSLSVFLKENLLLIGWNQYQCHFSKTVLPCRILWLCVCVCVRGREWGCRKKWDEIWHLWAQVLVSLGGVSRFWNHSVCSSSTGLVGGVTQEVWVNAEAGASENMEGIFTETQPACAESVF